MRNKMHIGIVLPSVPGYSETFFRSKISGLQQNGFQVTLFVKNPKNTKGFLCPVVVHPMIKKQLPLKLLQSFFILLKMILVAPKATIRMIKLERLCGNSVLQAVQSVVVASSILPYKLDWLHFGFATPALERENIGKAIGAKVAVSFRGFDINQATLAKPELYDLLWTNVDKVHSISNYLVEKAQGFGLPKSVPFAIITPALDAAKFVSKPEKRVSNSLLLVSRLHWIKGIEYVLLALAESKKTNPDISMTIVGEGDERERLIFTAHQLGILSSVNFVGKLPHEAIIDQMQTHEIFVQYSMQEGFCNAALEAQATEMLCIASDAEGLQENIIDGKTGWIVPKRNPEALAKKIIEVLSLSDEKKNEIRKNARIRIEREFSIENQQRKFIDFYKNE